MKMTHVDDKGQARMVDIGAKPVVYRRAIASGKIWLQPSTRKEIQDQRLPKGDVLAAARLAGIMAAKKTAEWIPLCHNIPLEVVGVDFGFEEDGIRIRAWAHAQAKTGAEMEALTAVAAAGLTIYDMCKAIDKSMIIGDIRLEKKSKDEIPR